MGDPLSAALPAKVTKVVSIANLTTPLDKTLLYCYAGEIPA
jgi:hypothetical protein